ncbi:MAG: tetratricopeptide repeat protein [Betaproteobacteria bacterium]
MEKGTSEIVKLTERISKDPKSKLFVPLAEEYKKAGDIEMAIYVLSEGLKNNPGYVTARSLLGRLLLERGDLDAARKELDEVVKAIPDNLLAQRRLGDLHVLQDNRTEAIKHYKIALALNPGDAEFASLVADAEAGLDIRPKLQQQKTKSSPEPAKKSKPLEVSQQHAQTPTAPPVRPAATRPAAATTPEPSRMTVSKDEAGPTASSIAPKEEKTSPGLAAAATGETGKTEKQAKPVEATKQAEPKEDRTAPAESTGTVQEPASSSLRQEAEEPEEVLVVEPLEDERPSEETLSSDIDSLAEKVEGPVATTAVEEKADVLLAAQELPLEEPELFVETKTVFPAAAEEAAVTPSDEITIVTPEAESAVEKGDDQSDDFTTDTLAELYIAQGFYEKAIDIYQRMLADHPNSRELKEKLERVSALAAQGETPPVEAGKSIEPPKEKTDEKFFDFAELKEFMLPEEATEQEEDATIEAELLVEPEAAVPKAQAADVSGEENLYAEPKEYKPTAEAEPESGRHPSQELVEEESYDIFMPGPDQESVRPKSNYADFEPREYIPPTAEPRTAKTVNVQADTNPLAATRKETIDRLENWLQNIKKEK